MRTERQNCGEQKADMVLFRGVKDKGDIKKAGVLHKAFALVLVIKQIGYSR